MTTRKKKDQVPEVKEQASPSQELLMNIEALMGDFYAESDEHLQSLKANLLALEAPASEGGAMPIGRLEEMFRHFHTLKGLCAMVGFKEAEDAAHEVESALRELRGKEVYLTKENLEAISQFVSFIEQSIESKRLNIPQPQKSILGDATLRLKDLGEKKDLRPETGPMPVEGPPVQEGPQVIKRGLALSEMAERELQEELSRGRVAYLFHFRPSKEAQEKGINVNSLREMFKTKGRLIHAEPRIPKEGGVSFAFLVTLQRGEEIIEGLKGHGLEVQLYQEPALSKKEALPIQDITRPKGMGVGTAGIVRVDISRIENIMGMVGELVITRARLEDLVKGLQREQGSKKVRPFQEVSQKMERQLRTLREGVMRLRMVPIGDVFSRMQYVLRDLVKDTGKEVVLNLEGKDTELDKFVVERMVDPLLHLVRNAVSHGIEDPKAREVAGKPRSGNILLKASTSGDQVIILVEDDGRGLDTQLIEEKARREGLLLPGEALTPQRLLGIICSPGFSTRDEADRASGRGVGMAVVKDTISELGGELSVESTKGKGTRFTISLPLTLAITDAFIVLSGGQSFAIPQGLVSEVIEIRPDMITKSQDLELIIYRGAALPIVRLSRLFGLPEEGHQNLYALVMGGERSQRGLVIDRVQSRREIVVRPILDPIVQVRGISGATELGDGRAVLILDSTVTNPGQTAQRAL